MRVTIHQPQFMPWLGYLDKVDQADLFLILDTVQFKKNEWQNRNRIRTSQGWQWLTVPVLQQFGQRIDDVLINPTAIWKVQHLRALEMHYARAPYLDHYLPQLRELYTRPWTKLSDLNKVTVQWLLKAYGILTPVRCASEFNAREEPTDRLIDLCRAVGAAEYLAGAGAERYMDKPRFEASGIRLERQTFQHPSYRQIYEPFEANLSALDLLLLQGPEALETLRHARLVRHGVTTA
ncbi:MAG: WbqC family protein [Nitrospira sp.]|nr:WbqC family protein [Nitrospira sp.]MBX3332859.1 WbqC family protein [Nitrospira sp.]MDR4463716.1 WbqC family protein [Nitrospira sp.]